MPRIEFEADTEEQLLALAWRWVMGPQRQSGGPVTRRRQIRPTFAGASWARSSTPFVGADSRRLLREVAELSTRDAALVLDAELAARYGKTHGHRLRRHRRRPEQGDATGRPARPHHLGRRCAGISHGSGRCGDRPSALARTVTVAPTAPRRRGQPCGRRRNDRRNGVRRCRHALAPACLGQTTRQRRPWPPCATTVSRHRAPSCIIGKTPEVS